MQGVDHHEKEDHGDDEDEHKVMEDHDDQELRG